MQQKIKNGEKNIMSDENTKIRQEMEPVITDLLNQGITPQSHTSGDDMTGLGDVVEATLTKFGLQERFKEWFNLEECNLYLKRKAWLNNLFSWKKNKE